MEREERGRTGKKVARKRRARAAPELEIEDDEPWRVSLAGSAKEEHFFGQEKRKVQRSGKWKRERRLKKL